MIYLANKEINREKNLINYLDFMVKAFNEKDRIKIVFGNLGNRLYDKFLADGLVDKDVFKDVNQAAKEYIWQKKYKEFPNTSFIMAMICNYWHERDSLDMCDFFKNVGLQNFNYYD